MSKIRICNNYLDSTVSDMKNNQENITDDEDVEVEELSVDVVLMEQPFDPTKINIETKTPSLDTLIKRMQRNHIQMDTSSYFQRKDDLWNVEQQSRLIESILIRFPLPAFFFDASDDDMWLVVDGLQRLSSIRNFCQKGLKLTNLEFLTQLNGKSWDQLSGDLQRSIEEAQVVIYKIMPGTPTDVKFNIFKRINTGGLVLEPQEIRHALFQGKAATFIEKLAKNKAFLKATDSRIPTKRMLDRDFANRFLAFYLIGYENYHADLDTFMSKAMGMLQNKSESELQKIEDDFTRAMELAYDIFKEEAFRKIYQEYDRLPPINKAIFDAIAAQFALLKENEIEILRRNGSSFKESFYNKLKENKEFFTSVSSATGDKNRISERHTVVKKIIHNTITML